MQILWGRILTSKTLWTNVILLLLVVADYISANASGFPQVPPQYVALVIVICNCILRFITNDGLLAKKD